MLPNTYLGFIDEKYPMKVAYFRVVIQLDKQIVFCCHR
jgi:hypothetical protein